MSNSSIWPIDRTLPGATTSGQSGPGSDGNEEARDILFRKVNCLMSYSRHSLWVFKDVVGIFYSPNRLGEFVY